MTELQARAQAKAELHAYALSLFFFFFFFLPLFLISFQRIVFIMAYLAATFSLLLSLSSLSLFCAHRLSSPLLTPLQERAAMAEACKAQVEREKAEAEMVKEHRKQLLEEIQASRNGL